jgi:uncharacterized protein with HEPN domain
VRKEPEVFLHHILESIDLIEEYLSYVTQEEFYKIQHWQDSLIRRLELMGEAVKNLPASFKLAHPDLPWKDIAGMRDVLAHDYFDLNLPLIWKTISQDVPKIKKLILTILSSLEESNKEPSP